MGKFKVFLFLVVLGACAVYVYLFSIVNPNSKQFAVVVDNTRGTVIRIVGPGYTFIREGLFPKRITRVYFSKKASDTFELRVPIHSLAELKNERYSIVIPMTLYYEASLAELSIDMFKDGELRQAFPSYLKKVLTEILTRELYRYCVPVYNRDLLLRESDALIARVIDLARQRCRKNGITITETSVAGIVRLPDQAVYADGLKYQQELRDVERLNARELLQLQGKIERDRMDTEQYVQRLERISALVKKNPDLLRYIYIDRIADKVKVMIVPERAGMPFGMDFDGGMAPPPKPAAKKGDVDNLR